MKFIIFTQTDWSEPTRIRQQIASLLLENGHEVHFFQKSSWRTKKSVQRHSEGFYLYTMPHLVHNQLKFSKIVNRLNNLFLMRNIQNLLTIEDDDVVINFNYDYGFLREVFPKNPIITFINDDFVSGVRIPIYAPFAKNHLKKVTQMADETLVTAYPVHQMIQGFISAPELFFPWARHTYQKPKKWGKELLCWGYINERLDIPLIMGIMEQGYVINFIGPYTNDSPIKSMLKHPNAHHHGVGTLDQFGPVLERCSASILPYNLIFKQNLGCSLSNRTMELLSWGLPVLIRKWPANFVGPEAFMYYCECIDTFIEAADKALNTFEEVQPGIEAFLKDHYKNSRYEQLMACVERAQNRNLSPRPAEPAQA